MSTSTTDTLTGTARRAWAEGYRFSFPGGAEVVPHHPDGREVPESLRSMCSDLGFHNGARLLSEIARLEGESAALDVAEGRRGVSGEITFPEGSMPFEIKRAKRTLTPNQARAARRRARKK